MEKVFVLSTDREQIEGIFTSLELAKEAATGLLQHKKGRWTKYPNRTPNNRKVTFRTLKKHSDTTNVYQSGHQINLFIDAWTLNELDI